MGLNNKLSYHSLKGCERLARSYNSCLHIHVCMIQSERRCGKRCYSGKNSYIYMYIYMCYVQVEILYKLQLVHRACTSCNLYKQFVQVATRTRLAVQVVTCTEFHYQIIPICTILLHKLDLKRVLVKLTILLKMFLILCVNK